MVSQQEGRILILWAIAIAATAIIADTAYGLLLGVVFFFCMIGSLVAVRSSSERRTALILITWFVALSAMIATTSDAKAGVLAPLYFVCMLGSLFTTRKMVSA